MRPLSGAISVEVIYKLLNYFRLHDNSLSQKIRLKGIDVLKHCTPQYIKTWRNKEGDVIDSFQNIGESKTFLRLLAMAINEVCRVGLLNAMPGTEMRNLITRIENVDSGDILIHYGNRRNRAISL
jgi:hypothetical protein